MFKVIMIITVENFLDNQLFVADFLSVITMIGETKNFHIFGGTVRDVIIPMLLKNENEISVCSFRKLLEEQKQVEINNIDVICFKNQSVFDMKIDILSYMRCWDWEEEKDLNMFESTFDLRDLGIKSKKIYSVINKISKSEINIEFVLADRKRVVIDFDVNNVMWDFRNGVRAIRSEKKQSLWGPKMDDTYVLYNIVENIKNKTCRFHDDFIEPKDDYKSNPERIIKMLSKGFLIIDNRLDVISSYVNRNDAMCIICREELKEDQISFLMCNGKDHYHCGTCVMKWFKERQLFQCCCCKQRRKNV